MVAPSQTQKRYRHEKLFTLAAVSGLDGHCRSPPAKPDSASLSQWSGSDALNGAAAMLSMEAAMLSMEAAMLSMEAAMLLMEAAMLLMEAAMLSMEAAMPLSSRVCRGRQDNPKHPAPPGAATLT